MTAPDTDPAAAFGARLSLAMKLLNISRGALAAEAKADKSLVSRWARGLTAPRGHNLAVLTGVVRARSPGFTQLTWDLPLEDFARALGAAEAPAPAPVRPPTASMSPPVAEAALGDYLTGVDRSRAQSSLEVEREGHAYPGIYAAFRLAFRNTGEIVPDLHVLWRRGGRLFFRTFDPTFSHTGEVFILRHQLFIIAEDDQRLDGLAYYILNGVTGRRALRIDGIALSVAGDRHRTPTAAPVVWQRLGDLEDEGEPPDAQALTAISERMKAAYVAREIAPLAGPDVEAAIRPMVGSARPDGSMDHLLRTPMDRSLLASEVEITDALEADMARVRAAFC